MQVDLDNYLHTYNYDSAHQGRNMHGRTPYQGSVREVSSVPTNTDNGIEICYTWMYERITPEPE
jgi:hypothetical protein